MHSAKDLFSLKLGVGLWINSLGLGWLGNIIAPFIEWALGSMIDFGIFKIDITINAIQEGMKKSEFKDLAQKAHDSAIKKVYTEQEKDAIRRQYLDILSKFVAFGNGVQHN